MRSTILMPATLAHQKATEIEDKTFQYEEAISIIANLINERVGQGKKFVDIDCIRLNFSEKVKSMWTNALVKEGYSVDYFESRTPHVRISWEIPNKPIPRS